MSKNKKIVNVEMFFSNGTFSKYRGHADFFLTFSRIAKTTKRERERERKKERGRGRFK